MKQNVDGTICFLQAVNDSVNDVRFCSIIRRMVVPCG